MPGIKRITDRIKPKRWADWINENLGAALVASVAVCFLMFLAHTIPSTLDGMSYMDAIKDAFGLRIAKLAIFDLHAIGILYFYGGKEWKIIQSLKTKPISTALILTAILIGSAMMLM